MCESVNAVPLASCVSPAALSCNENDGESLDRDSQYSSTQKTKRMRTSFKHHQLRTMKSYFAINHNPDAKDLKQLAQKTGLTKRVLQVRRLGPGVCVWGGGGYRVVANSPVNEKDAQSKSVSAKRDCVVLLPVKL